MKTTNRFTSSWIATLTFAVIQTLTQAKVGDTPAAKEPSKFLNWGIFNNTSRSHVSAPDAWKITHGSRKVVVAVVDTGVDFNHPSLRDNQWKDPSFSKDNVYGWDYVKQSPNPKDDHGHGTHVAGIIGAMTNTQSGTSGLSPEVSLMAVKYYSEKNSGAKNLANTIRALNYAIDHGAQIINYSGGGAEYSEEEYQAMKRAESRGILVVAAAGNESQNTDVKKNFYYPAAYHLSNVITVTAIDIQNHVLSSSNWGEKSVDIAAPGERIYSTLPNGKFGYMTGTSQATPFVSSTAVLLKAMDPSLKPQDIRSLIRESADRMASLKGKVASGGKLNAYAALMALKTRNSTPGIFSRVAVTRSLAEGFAQ